MFSFLGNNLFLALLSKLIGETDHDYSCKYSKLCHKIIEQNKYEQKVSAQVERQIQLCVCCLKKQLKNCRAPPVCSSF